MNIAFRVVWNASKGVWQAVGEIGPSKRKSKSRGLGSISLAAVPAIVGSLLLLSLSPLVSASALPSGGQVNAGSAEISVSGNKLRVVQSSQKAVIDWQSFSIGQGNEVEFSQPSAQAAALNRVTGSQVSDIRGSLKANGQVFLINPNGILFSATSEVNVGALVSSTLDISNEDFISGNYNFEGAGAGIVINRGNIHAAEGGFVAMIAASVINTGSIDAYNGTVAMAAGKRIVLDIGGPVKISVEEGAIDAYVEQGGAVRVDSGLVLLTAKAAGELTSSAINHTGITEAQTLQIDASGRIVLVGDGDVNIAGTLDVSGAEGKGGQIQITGAQVALQDGALLDASGRDGGGQVLVGGDYQGKNAAVPNAIRTYVDEGARIVADATGKGDGGKIIVWAGEHTDYAGHLSATGGSEGGDGGFAEVSGKQTLDFKGTVDLTAQQGKTGTLLLDPTNLTITEADNNVSDDVTPDTYKPTGEASTLSVSTLTTALDSANVIVTTNGSPDTGTEEGDITVASSIGWLSNNTLTLDAAGAITINNAVNIQTFDGSLVLTAGGAITQTHTTGGRLLIGGTTTLTSGADITLTSLTNQLKGIVTATATGAISITNARALVLGNTSASGLVTLATVADSGSITANGTFAAGTLSAAAHDTGGISIVDVNGPLTVSLLDAGGAITLGNANSGALTFTHSVDGSNVIVGNDAAGGQASGIVTITGASLTLNDAIRTKGGTVNLISTTGAITTAADADIVTTADVDTGTASGLVNVTADNGMTLQNITTTGADNTIGVGSNAAAVTLTARAGDIHVGAITTTGGDATAGATDNRNGGNAGNILLAATAGTDIYLDGDLEAIGGGFVGAASQGLGGYIKIETPAILTANRLISSGVTSGNIDLLASLDSDTNASYSLNVVAGVSDVMFDGVMGGTNALTSLTASGVNINIEKNVTTDGAAGLNIDATQEIRLGDNDLTNGLGTITINTLAGNGSVDLNSGIGDTTGGGYSIYLDDAVTFTRGTGSIVIHDDFYSNTNEGNDLTFDGAGGGTVVFGGSVGGTSATANTKFGNILFDSVTDITTKGISAESLISLNGTGSINTSGGNGSAYYLDGAGGLQLSTTGADTAGDENITFYPSVYLTEASAPIWMALPNGSITLGSSANLVTAGGGVTLNAGTSQTLSGADISTSGGAVILTAGSKAGIGALTLGSSTDITTSNGLLSLTGTGISQSVTNSVLNAGSGKIRIDAGGSTISLYSRLITSDNDSSNTPSILVSNASATSFRSVETKTGTFQVGLIAGDANLAGAQTPVGAENLALTTAEIRLREAQAIKITSAGDDSAATGANVTFTVTGTNAAGDPLIEAITGGTAAAVTTTGLFKTITSITSNKATAGAVSVGLAADDTVAGSLTQYIHNSYSDNQIDIKTLSAATTGQISVTSTANIINELGGFSVGSSLDVRASGRTTGMVLTGDVTATNVTIKTGVGVLALGDRDITATSGNTLLQGRGVTQGAGSTVSTTGTVTVYGSDYASQGTRGDVVMAGNIVADSTNASSAVTIADTNAITIGSITTGSAGSRGGLRLGTHDHNGSTYRRAYGAIDQTAGSQLTIGALDIRQLNGSGSIDLSLLTNEIQSVGYVERGGAISLFDKDTEANGLILNGGITAGTNSNAVKIETLGALDNRHHIYGQGITLAGASITSNNQLYAYMGSGENRDLVLQASGGDVTLSGDVRIDGIGNDFIINNAGNVRLGLTYWLDGELQIGSLGVSGALATSQTVGAAADLTLDGTAISSGTATFDVSERVAITSAGDDSGIAFTVTGTDMFGRAQTEVITGASAAIATGSKYFATINQIATNGAAAGSVIVGTALENITGNVTQTSSLDVDSARLSGVVDGNVTLENNENYFTYIDDLTVGGDISLSSRSRTNTLHVAGDVASATGNISIRNNYFGLYVDSTGSVTGHAADSQVTLTATDNYNSNHNANIQGAIVAGTAGIVLSSDYGSVYTSGAGTLTTTGTATVNSYINDTVNIQAGIAADAGIDINSQGTFANSAAGTLTSSAGSVFVDSGDLDSMSIGVAVQSATGVFIDAGGTFVNSETITSNGEVIISSGGSYTGSTNYSTSIQNAISAGVGGTGNLTINSRGNFTNNTAGILTATGSIALQTYWDGTYERNMTLAGNIAAGANGIQLTSSGTINQTGGVLTTTGTLSGPSQNGGTANSSVPSARGAVTLTANNEIANLGPFYLYDEAQVDFTLNDVSGGLTLAGTIENSHGSINISTAGGALDLSSYDVYAGGMATGGAAIALTGQGLSQGAGSEINTTGGATDNARTGSNGGGTITLTGHDGSAAGAISLAGGISTVNDSTSAITLRGTTNLQLPGIIASKGSLVLGDDTATIGLITGNISQSNSTALDIKTLKVGTATNAVGGSVVLANSTNKIETLAELYSGAHQFTGPATDIPYDLDIYDSTGGLSLTGAVVSGQGIRISTTDNTTGVLSIGANSILASGDIYLGGLSVTQAAGSTIDADNSGAGGIGGSIRIDGGGSANNITLEGIVTTDNASATAIEIVNATNATLNTVNASAGALALGVDTKELTGTVSQLDVNSTISAATLVGDAGVVTINKANIDNLGQFTTSGVLTLKEQGGSGTAGLKYTGSVTTGGTTWIETTDGIQNLDTQTLDATGQAITLKGVALSQQAASTINTTTADLYGGTGDIDLFSATNDFTGQVTVNSAGSHVNLQDANQLSMNALTGKLATTTSIKLHAGTFVSLTTENLTTTTGDIEFKSLGGLLNTPGKLTTGSGDITLYSSETLSLAEKILSTSGDVDIEAAIVASRAGASDYIQTGGAGTINIRATSGNFTQGSDVIYTTVDGDITLSALAGNVTLANVQSSTGDLNVTAGGNILQLSGSAITVAGIDALTKKDAIGNITLTEAINNAAAIRLRTLNGAGDTTVGGVIQYEDADGFAIREILTAADATLVARGEITADISGYPGTVKADTFTVKTLLDAGAGVDLTQANDVNSLNIKVRNAADDAIADETTTPTGTIKFTDSDGFVVTAIETAGTTVLTAGDAVTQTGAISSAKLGLSGVGDYTLTLGSSGIPLNQISTFASDATGAVYLTTNLDLVIGSVNPEGITTEGADISITAPKITSTGVSINTSSLNDSTAGGSVLLSSTALGSLGDLTVGDIVTSGTAAAGGSGNGGGAAGTITLTSAGDLLSVEGVITARGGAGDGVAGGDGTVKLLATAGAVLQANGDTEINAGKVLLDALNSSALLDVDNMVDKVAAKISGIGENFTYRSGADYEVGGGQDGITGITTQGGFVDIGNSDYAISVTQNISTKGGDFSATGVGSFNYTGLTISTAGDITYASGAYKDGGTIDISTTANNGNVNTGTLVSSGDVNAAAAAAGNITLDANGILTVHATKAQGQGSGTGGVVSFTGSAVNIAGSVVTSSTGAAGGMIDVNGPAVLVGGDHVLATGLGAGDIDFSSTLNSDGTPRALSITAGSGDILLNGAVGVDSTLGALNIVSANDVTISDTLAAASLVQSAGTGTSTLDGAVTLSANLAFTGNNLSVNAATDVGGTTTISNAGLFTTAAAGDITSVGIFGQIGAGTNELAGDISTTNTGISFAKGVVLTGGVAMDTNTGMGNIVFADFLDSDTTPRDMILTSGTGNVTFAGIVGGTNTLGVLNVNSAGSTTFSDAVTATSVTTDAAGTIELDGQTVNTTGTQTYNDGLSLGDNTILTGTTITTKGSLTGASHSLLVTGDAVFGDATGDTVTGLTTLAINGTAAINTSIVTSSGTQEYTGAVTIGADTTLTTTDATVTFDATINSLLSVAKSLAINAGNGDVNLMSAVGAETNGALGSLALTGNNLTLHDVTTTGEQTYNGTINTNSTYTSDGSNITFNGDLTINDALVVTTGAAAGTITFTGTLDSQTGETNTLHLTAGTGDIALQGAVGTTQELGTININSATNVTTGSTINATSLTQLAGSGTTTIDGAVTLTTVEGISLTGTNLILNAAVDTVTAALGGTVTTNHSGTAIISASGDINADGAVTITADGGISTAGDITTTGDEISLQTAVTLTGDTALFTGGATGAINFASTIDGAYALRLLAGAAQSFNAVGGTAPLTLLRVESTGEVTQTAAMKVGSLAIKSAGATLENTDNDIDTLAALMSGDASLTFVDVDGVEIGTIDAAELQIIGISDGAGTSNVSITVGGLLSQAVNSPILIDGDLTVDTTDFAADDVSFKNTSADGTELDNSLVAGDFSIDSSGNVTQSIDANGSGADAWVQVGGSFNMTGTGAFVAGNSTDNFIGGSATTVAANEIRLVGVITLSMVDGNLVASATTGTGETDTGMIAAADLTNGAFVTSDAGGKSMSAVTDGDAILLNESNSIGGSVKITTKGSYENSGSSIATGIRQSEALILSGDSSFVAMQSTANSNSEITGANTINLSHAENAFAGTVSAAAVGMDIHLRDNNALNLGTVNGKQVTIELADASSSDAITQTGVITATTLLLQNAGAVTLNNNNRITTVAANVNGALSLANNQPLTVGTVVAVNGITAGGDITLASDALAINQAVTAAGFALTLKPLNSATSIGLGDGVGGLSIDAAEWNNLTDGFSSIIIGRNDGTGKITTGALTVTDNLTLLNTSGGIELTGLMDAGTNTMILDSMGAVTDTGSGSITAASLALHGAEATYTLDAASNDVDVLSANSGNVTYVDADALSLGTVAAMGAVDISTTTADLTVSQNISATAIKLNAGQVTAAGTATGGNVILTGSPSLTASMGNAIIYTGSIADSTGVAESTTSGSGNFRYNSDETTDFSTGGWTDLGATGNYAVYREQPVISVAVVNKTVTYGDADPTSYTGSYTGLLNGDAASIVTGTDTAVWDNAAGTTSTGGKRIVGDYDVAYNSGLSNGLGYGFADKASSVDELKVDQLALSGSITGGGNTYGSAVTAGTVDFVSSITGDAVVATGTVSVDTTGLLSTSGNLQAGTHTGIQTVGAGLSGTDAGNYSFAGRSDDYIVDQLGLTLSGITAANRIYDASTDATVSVTAANYASLISGDLLTVAAAGVFDIKHVGTGKTVTLTSTYSGVDKGNYSITDQATTTAGISAANLVITTSDVSKTYDGTTAVTMGSAVATSSTQVFSDDSLTGGTYAFIDAHVSRDGSGAVLSNKTVTTTGVTINDGNKGGNYAVSYADNITSTIDPKALSIELSNQIKAYDGSINAAIDTTDYSLTGIIGSENVGVNQTVGTYDSKDMVSATNVTVALASTDFAADTLTALSDYILPTTVVATGSITRATLTAVADVQDRIYDATTDGTLNDITLQGLIGSETLQVAGGTARFADKNVGVDKVVTVTGITISNGTGAEAGLSSNYQIASPATTTASISKKGLTIAGVEAFDREYNGKMIADINTDAASLTGKITEDEVTFGSMTGSFLDKNVGGNKVVIGSDVVLEGADAGNYDLIQPEGLQATITQRALTVSVTAADKVYDGGTDVIVTVTDDRVSGDLLAYNYVADFVNKNVGNTKSFSVDNISFSGGADEANYTVNSSASGVAAVTVKPIAISGITAGDKTYDGNTVATIDVSSASGWISGDDVTVAATGAFATKDVGTDKTVTLSSTYGGIDESNYAIINQSTTTADVQSTTTENVRLNTIVTNVVNTPTSATRDVTSENINSSAVNRNGFSSNASDMMTGLMTGLMTVADAGISGLQAKDEEDNNGE
jgi:filamentous hemagglutinin family protein